MVIHLHGRDIDQNQTLHTPCKKLSPLPLPLDLCTGHHSKLWYQLLLCVPTETPLISLDNYWLCKFSLLIDAIKQAEKGISIFVRVTKYVINRLCQVFPKKKKNLDLLGINAKLPQVQQREKIYDRLITSINLEKWSISSY